MARRRAAEATVPIEFAVGSAMALPLADNSVDTIVMTWTLCSIPDPAAALAEMRRVLKPDGELLFVEHGLAPEPSVEAWQHRLTPLWQRIGGGCHSYRKMDTLIEAAGFNISKLQTGYAPGPRPLGFMYQGCACHADAGRRPTMARRRATRHADIAPTSVCSFSRLCSSRRRSRRPWPWRCR